ncbi:MAG: MFS transporter [Betaproteobacteria bacterium]|jgi:MFS transporter, BCD family, chlorophyll transporter|nr:MFS transporter [Betaproteobacteria bacterium]NBP44747.1 MFS transporter [Betaproteobacteria bacterium]
MKKAMSVNIPVPQWIRALGVRVMPFADVASTDWPVSRLVRLSLFQWGIGLVTALLVGTLNRVMILELQVPAWWVALSVALPMVFAPLRALIGDRSDTHPSALGLRRIPYLWMGSLLLFAGLAILPFALLLLSEGDGHGLWLGRLGAGLAFLLIGAGIQITQTAGMALANDVMAEDKRPRMVALLYAMLLIGLICGSAVYGWLLQDFSPKRLIQVIQGTALTVVVVNLVSMWKQEARSAKRGPRQTGGFGLRWQRLMAEPHMRRFLWTVALGTMAFGMQDVILEPYGGAVLHLSVGDTSWLTGQTALGSLVAFSLSAHWLSKGLHACRLSALGLIVGMLAFPCVIFSAPLDAAWMFQLGAMLIGFGGGLFAVGMLVTAMEFGDATLSGLVIGAWGAVQATASGVAMALGGGLRDAVDSLAMSGQLGEVLQSPVTGYSFVYHLELYLLFVVLVALGPMLRKPSGTQHKRSHRFGLAELPG